MILIFGSSLCENCVEEIVGDSLNMKVFLDVMVIYEPWESCCSFKETFYGNTDLMMLNVMRFLYCVGHKMCLKRDVTNSKDKIYRYLRKTYNFSN